MATAAAYAATPNNGSALLGAAETNLQVPTTTSTVITAGASGTKIEEIVVQASATSLVATTVAGLVYVFLVLDSGPTYHLFDTFIVSAITASSSAAPYRLSRTYPNLVIKTGWSVRASQSIVGNASLLKISVLAGDF